MKIKLLIRSFTVLALLAGFNSVLAQGTGFTDQGRLGLWDASDRDGE